MPYILYSFKHGPIAYVENSIPEARLDEIAIPCERGADMNDIIRWRIEAAYMKEHGAIAPTLELAKQVKFAEIAAERWKAETGGVVVGGMSVDTSRESQSLITGAALQATLDDAYICKWKTAQGFITLDAQTVLAVAAAMRQHVQAGFNREAELAELINAAATIEDAQALAWEQTGS